MAKLDELSKTDEAEALNKNKVKAKKRKSAIQDEIPNKTLLLSQKSKPPEKIISVKKRKSNTTSEFCPKKKIKVENKKSQNLSSIDDISRNTNTLAIVADSSDKDDNDDDDDNEDEIRQPTYYEIAQSEKPENTVNIITIRQKKKQKHQKNIEHKKERTAQNEIERNHNYLLIWKNNRKEWKFEKLRQISIQNSIFNDEKIPNHIWSIALEYLTGTKGHARDVLIELAEKQISQLDDEIEKTNNKQILKESRYKRARELLQMLQ